MQSALRLERARHWSKFKGTLQANRRSLLPSSEFHTYVHASRGKGHDSVEVERFLQPQIRALREVSPRYSFLGQRGKGKACRSPGHPDARPCRRRERSRYPVHRVPDPQLRCRASTPLNDQCDGRKDYPGETDQQGRSEGQIRSMAGRVEAERAPIKRAKKRCRTSLSRARSIGPSQSAVKPNAAFRCLHFRKSVAA